MTDDARMTEISDAELIRLSREAELYEIHLLTRGVGRLMAERDAARAEVARLIAVLRGIDERIGRVGPHTDSTHMRNLLLDARDATRAALAGEGDAKDGAARTLLAREMEGRGLCPAEQREQGGRCGCQGTDEYCGCQNVSDAVTRQRWLSEALAGEGRADGE